MSAQGYVHRVEHHTMSVEDGAFSALLRHLSLHWQCGPLELARADSADVVGSGKVLEFAGGEPDDNGQFFLVARIPGNASALKALSNRDLTGILYSLHNVWLQRRRHGRTPLYVCADRFDDRLLQRLAYLEVLVPRLTLLQVRNLSHLREQLDVTAMIPEPRGPEAAFAAAIVRAMEAGTVFGDLSLSPLGTEVPAGWARQRAERIDVLAVDQSGRLVVVELKAAGRAHQSDLRHVLFQGLRYWDWVRRHRRSLQILYGRTRVRDVQAEPVLLIVNGGADFPEEVLRMKRAAPTDGAEPLLRLFCCESAGEVQPVEV